jgi:hypothetical protein
MHMPQEFVELPNRAHNHGYQNKVRRYWQQCKDDSGMGSEIWPS